MKLTKHVKDIAKNLNKKKQTLGLAESCTGGHISSCITETPGASKFFNGCIVSYANSAKTDLLGVPRKVLIKHGAVSKQTAIGMALGARKALRSTWAVSVTGIAGPTGGSESKPVGLVFASVVGPNVEVVVKNIFKGSRKTIQYQAAEQALRLLLRYL